MNELEATEFLLDGFSFALLGLLLFCFLCFAGWYVCLCIAHGKIMKI